MPLKEAYNVWMALSESLQYLRFGTKVLLHRSVLCRDNFGSALEPIEVGNMHLPICSTADHLP
jgi:hypothetical protein